jgi:hypothetical protein
MTRPKHPTYAFDDDIEYEYIDRKAEEVKANTNTKMSDKKLTPKAIFNLMNAVERILETEASMFVSDETKSALEMLMPHSDGIDELFSFNYRANQEEMSKRLDYKKKKGQNPKSKWLKQQRIYYLPRIVEKRSPKS